MSTVGETIRQALPRGSGISGKGRGRWKQCPFWAPDAFAVAATLAERSGCYAEPGIALSRNPPEREEKQRRAEAARLAGASWSRVPRAPREARDEWQQLLSAWNEPLCSGVGHGGTWKRAALHLLAIADEACAGVGYTPEISSPAIRQVVFNELVKVQGGEKSPLCLPSSVTLAVPPDFACVLPKALTPEVGCTLRSLTHNLALLPGFGVVRPEWYIGASRVARASNEGDTSAAIIDRQDHCLNLLLIPFPYVIRGPDFIVARAPEDGVDGYFGLNQGWLVQEGEPVTRQQLNDFVSDLIKNAQINVGPVNGLVFPETALTPDRILDLADDLAAEFLELELIIGGTLQSGENLNRNEAVLIRLEGGIRIGQFVQAKHHRWRIAGSQISQYQLGHVLDPRFGWWGAIDVHSRTIQFAVNRHQAVIAALICEDLARFDPVLPVVTAVGPNLVVALLMDGPQLEARWSGRYATVLAEDPGSSVLTLTSLGMVLRSRKPGEEIRRVVGLWKERGGSAVQLTLPPEAHGIVLSLVCRHAEQRTLDLRSDGGAALEYTLGGVSAVGLTKNKGWVERRPRIP